MEVAVAVEQVAVGGAAAAAAKGAVADPGMRWAAEEVPVASVGVIYTSRLH